MTPLVSVIVPTAGQRMDGLQRTFRSIHGQRGGSADVEVLVLGDTLDGPLPAVEALTLQQGPHFRYAGISADRHCWGNLQRNAGNRLARGRWIAYVDDDDIFLPAAVETMRRAIGGLADPRPLLFRFMAPFRLRLWDVPALRPGRISGQCIVFPNLPDRIGTWTPDYEGDFAFIRSTVDLHGGDAAIAWRDELLVWTRPTESEDWTVREAVAA